MKKRAKLRKQIEKCANSRKKGKLMLNFVHVENGIKLSIEKECYRYEAKAINKMKSDSKSFFDCAKKNKELKRSIGALKNYLGELVYNTNEMANILNEQ